MTVPTLEYRDGCLRLLDQTRLPLETIVVECWDIPTLAEAITSLRVRGAPAIGLAAAYGVAVAARNLARAGVRGEDFRTGVASASRELAATRPTAVNLFWALDRMKRLLASTEGPEDQIAGRLLEEAHRMLAEDEASNRAMGRHGATLIAAGSNVLTHCNAGALATGAYGTAVGVIRSAHDSGKSLHVWVDETRPLLQGSRLTAWELAEAGIPHTLITDNMAAHFMQAGRVDCVIVGADRIAANGDTANKIGTYGVAVLARAHDLPFYVAAPTSTVDLSIPDGDSIPIEQRDPIEVIQFRDIRTAPQGTVAANPAFDVTPARLIAGIVTECGIARPPFQDDLARMVASAGTRRTG